MNKKSFIVILCLAAASINLRAQAIDTTGIYNDRADTLKATVFVARQSGNYLSKIGATRTEVISAAGLCKMACCNLAESFENSASVTVGYSDAVTGARQIRLLGQNGIYTQMLDENRPIMRGISAPFGLNYVPGQWLESIQIAKGVTSVINGVESMTGQINLEHRKPTDEKPFYLQASVMDDSKCDLNIVSALQLDPMETWSTVIMAHVDGNFRTMDMNSDGFKDDPSQLQFSLANRWLYYGQDGVQVRFGVRALQDHRNGGQMESAGADRWSADILNRNLNAYVKVGVPLSESNSKNIALVTDYTLQTLGSAYGSKALAGTLPFRTFTDFSALQHSAFANLIFQNELSENHRYTLGISESADVVSEQLSLSDISGTTSLFNTGIYGEYTYKDEDRLSAIIGLRADNYNLKDTRVSPRVTLRYSPSSALVLRANAGRGIRWSSTLTDNFGVFSSSKALEISTNHLLEDSWTEGANLTWYLPFDKSGKTYFGVDLFHTDFTEQMLIDYTYSSIRFYPLSSMPGKHYSYTNNIQLDFSTEPLRGLTLTLTGRLTDARQTLSAQCDDIKPMTSLYKAVFNAQYAARLNKWIIDFTASLNGPCRVWDFMKDIEVGGEKIYASGYTPVYPLLYAQITRRFKGFDVYVGGENLTNYTQPMPIIGAQNPFSEGFDASCVWGPIMGARVYAGIRMTIWKKE